MNAARQRRQALKRRIEKQRQAELKKPYRFRIPTKRESEKFEKILERYRNSPEGMEWKLRQEFGLDQVRRAFVFLDLPGTVVGRIVLPRIVTTWLSAHNPTQKIMDMKKNGFWAWDRGYLTWFDPGHITEVCFDNE